MTAYDCDVLIAGAGPVGLTLAATLAGRGISVLVLEPTEELSTAWRASTFHPPTLELLEELKVTETMLDMGLIAPTYQIRDRSSGLLAEFDLAAIADKTRYPFRLQLEQYKYSRILVEQLATSAPESIVRGRRVVDIAHEESAVVVGAVDSVGDRTTYRARYVAAADGASSAVRKALGIEFTGMTYEERFLILSTPFDYKSRMPDLSLVNYIWDPVEPMMLLRIPDVWRVMFTIPEGLAEASVATPAVIQDKMRRVVSVGDDTTFEVSSVQTYRVHQRIAEHFRCGRVMLVGDAAHINSPVGGLGLNSGIHDALDLGVRLERVLASGSDDELDRFEEVRRRVAFDVVRQITDRNTRQMTEHDAMKREQNRFQLESVARDPMRSRQWMLDSAMITAVEKHGIGC